MAGFDDLRVPGVIHAPPGWRKIPLEISVLTMKFKMFKGGEVVGEVEKVATYNDVGGGKYEYVVEVDGYVFDCYEVVVRDMDGRVIHKKAYNTPLDKGQALIYKIILKVV
jgi:hypothetical protein